MSDQNENNVNEKTSKVEQDHKDQNEAKVETSPETSVEAKASSHDSRGERKARGSKGSQEKPRRQSSIVGDPELEERVVAVNRVAKVVKGGRRFSFSALMIVGDKKGRVGYGLGKAKEVPEAIRKATQAAQKSMIQVPIDQGTIPHKTIGSFDAGKILFIPAGEGTGVKAAGACRSILELAGIRDVLTKSLRGNNPHNIVKATFSALKNLRSVEQVASVRGKTAKNLRIK